MFMKNSHNNLFTHNKSTIVSINDSKSIIEIEREILAEINKEHSKAQKLIDRAYKKYELAVDKVRKPYIDECVIKYYKNEITEDIRKSVGKNKRIILKNIKEMVCEWTTSEILNYTHNNIIPQQNTTWFDIISELQNEVF